MAARSALVTGASGGIGSATVRALLRAGYEVHAGVRRPGAIDQLVSEGAHEVEIDVTDDPQMRRAIATIEADAGPLDLLVNNAGYAIAGPLEEISADSLRRQFEVNVLGVLRMTQLVLPGMRAAGRGRIVTIGSVGGLFAAPGAGGYHMSKYAIEAFADSLRTEVHRFGVKVILLEPTGVRTPFITSQLATMPDTGPDSPYATFKANMDESVRALFAPGSRAVVPAEAVARVVVKAATASRPRARYKVGAVAHVLPRVRRLIGDRGWDAMARRQFAAA